MAESGAIQGTSWCAVKKALETRSREEIGNVSFLYPPPVKGLPPIFFLAVQYNLIITTMCPGYWHCPWHLSDFDVFGCGQGPFLRRRHTRRLLDRRPRQEVELSESQNRHSVHSHNLPSYGCAVLHIGPTWHDSVSCPRAEQTKWRTGIVSWQSCKPLALLTQLQLNGFALMHVFHRILQWMSQMAYRRGTVLPPWRRCLVKLRYLLMVGPVISAPLLQTPAGLWCRESFRYITCLCGVWGTNITVNTVYCT
jgi:hypothetical protein